jgi:hypothetical protein
MDPSYYINKPIRRPSWPEDFYFIPSEIGPNARLFLGTLYNLDYAIVKGDNYHCSGPWEVVYTILANKEIEDYLNED